MFDIPLLLCFGVGVFLVLAFVGWLVESFITGKHKNTEAHREWWQTEREPENYNDALSEHFADRIVYNDENGDRHLEISYIRESGEKVIVSDEITRYGDIPPWKGK